MSPAPLGPRPFGPGDVAWEVNREAVLLLGGVRALLLQVAHPLVAQGVADHSDFLRAPIGRLRRTLAATYTILFDEPTAVEEAARAVRAAHARVRGTLREGTARFPEGTPYAATDADLLLWVHATLVDSALAAYACYVRPLSAREREAFYAQIGWVGRVFGVPDDRLPPSLDAFNAYLRDVLDGDTLEITPTARRLADAVLSPPAGFVPRWLAGLGSIPSVGLLPASVRRRFGLRWDRHRQRAFRTARALLRGAIPLLPDVARAVPQARRAERRTRARAAPGMLQV